MDWEVGRLRGPTRVLHSRVVDFTRRSATVLEVTDTAVVVGSAQPAEGVRRRSGGGAVLVRPGDPLWVDVVVPRGDPLWHDDIGRAFWWLGEVWAAAVGDGAEVHRGPLVTTRWSQHVCFAGLGPGEVTVEGRKVVGIAQRRTREGALFQCAVHRRWDPKALVSKLRLFEHPDDALRGAVLPMGDRLDELEQAFLDGLP